MELNDNHNHLLPFLLIGNIQRDNISLFSISNNQYVVNYAENPYNLINYLLKHYPDLHEIKFVIAEDDYVLFVDYEKIGTVFFKNNIYSIVINGKSYTVDILLYKSKSNYSDFPYNLIDNETNILTVFRVYQDVKYMMLRYQSHSLNPTKDIITLEETGEYLINCSMDKDNRFIPYNDFHLNLKIIPELQQYTDSINLLIKHMNSIVVCSITSPYKTQLVVYQAKKAQYSVKVFSDYQFSLASHHNIIKVLKFINDNYYLFQHPIFSSFFEKLNPYMELQFKDNFNGTIKSIEEIQWYITLAGVENI